jgi:hypothetical protein
MNNTKRLFFTILALSILFSYPPSALSQKVKVIDNVKHIMNNKKPNPPKGALVKMTLTEEYSIGGAEKDEEVFSESIFITVDDKENIYVLDMKLNNVKVFDNSGTYIRTFGKQGQGPGELNMPIGIQVTPNGELMVEEVLNRRLSFFTPEGEFLRSTSTADKTSLTGLRFGPEGSMVGRELVLAENKMEWYVKKYDADLNEIFTVDKVDFPNILQGKINPFDLMIVFDLDKNGNIIYGTSKEYEIKFINPAGTHVKSISKEYDPIKITEEDKKEILSRIPETGGISVKDMIEFPKYYPAFQNFTIDEKGRIFVRTFEKGKKEGEYICDIFDPEGRFISQIPLKANPALWKNNKLYATEESDEGYILIKCFKVSWEKP